MLRTIVAIERDGLDIRTLNMTFEVPNEQFDLIGAIKKAATDYCKTEMGKQVYAYNCHYFNWADFEMNVPDEFCEKHGFKRIYSNLSDLEVNWDEDLVDETEILGED